MVVSRAADIVEEKQLAELAPELIQAFETIAEDPAERDQSCEAMRAIVNALSSMSIDAPSVYLFAIRYVHNDGTAYTPDSATAIRGGAAMALVKTEHPRALEEAARLLLDIREKAREDAARALRAASSEAAAMALRMTLLFGEKDAGVCLECFGGLIESSETGLEFVASYLEGANDDLSAVAAVAIGEARRAEGFASLKKAWEGRTNPDLRQAVLGAIAALRTNEAIDFIVGLIGSDLVTAVAALEALTPYRADASLVARIEKAIDASKRRELQAIFKRQFD